jgi:hypothetical protein
MGGGMRLRNKKTGEIRELPDGFFCGDNLKKICEEWEDAPEEPKEYWYIEEDGDVIEMTYLEDDEFDQKRRQIGNYFDTREEAEKAVEKLKAWKRLKDKGFRFKLSPAVGSLDINPDKFQIEVNADMPVKWFCCDAVQEDLDVCFGGEE